MEQSYTRLTREAVRRQHAGKRRYITGFDGIRTLAVLGVIIYHLAPSTLQGGYLGVPIFFVVSGYLITYLLIQEWDKTQGINILGFYGRRLKRLYPALVTMLLGTTAYITLFQRSLLLNIRGTVLTNLIYGYNWFEIKHGQSYFDRFSGESPFTHLWSLSIEGQFYLVWPFVVLGLLLFLRKRLRVAAILLGVAILSAVLMAILYDPANTNRVYYGTDTRMFAILIGTAMAFLWPAHKLNPQVTSAHRLILDIAGGLSLLMLIWMFFNMSGQAASTYRGGMFWFTLLSGILVATVAHPGSDLNRVLTNPVFSYIGQRSYGIYLYQFPVMIFYEARVNIGNHPLLNSLIELALIMLVTELSYRLIENPMRHYHYGQLTQDVVQYFHQPSRHRWASGLGVAAALLFSLSAVGFVQQPASAQPTALQKTITARQAAAKKKNAAAAKKQRALAKAASQRKHDKAAALAKLSKADKKIAKTYFLSADELRSSKQTPLTAVGDSVLLDDSGDLQQVFPGAVVDGAVGRQADAVPGVIHSLAQRGELAKNVLVNIGTNGYVTPQQADDIVHAIGTDHQIFWVTAHVPTREWQDSVNNRIAKTAAKYKNVHVIDWYTTAKTHSSWFVSDHVHPNNQGNRYFTSLIAKAIAKETKA
ncbi:acetyltransferase [Levilactobacillus brevis]|uniref:acyltransferase family protein n=1 Tax=Levilactobacillus brevis TaxID=1580 RepID=UPI001BA9479E|nr:acyltransferase family protein [Levilactobacillus brevis]MBS1005192.1 acetyltransferase [Levilactobacillus brevis]MBS1012117.1 acetyltransferase [Levilactobacillus brevis]